MNSEWVPSTHAALENQVRPLYVYPQETPKVRHVEHVQCQTQWKSLFLNMRCQMLWFIFPEPPGKVKDLKLTGSSYTTLSLSWTKPTEVKGVEDEAKGYFLEIRPTGQLEWSRCNTSAVIQTSFTAGGLKSMAAYWLRVIATNEGGEGLPEALDNYITAMPPPGKHLHNWWWIIF